MTDPAEDTARTAGPADRDRAVDILVGAFRSCPTWGDWAFPDPATRDAGQWRLWSAYVDSALPRGTLWLTPDASAVAVWTPPGADELTAAQHDALGDDLGGLFGPRLGAALAAFERFADARPAEPHWYLSLLGTDPAHRGRGLGLGLLADTLQLADDDGLPAYLEASNPVNVPLYQRYGFGARTVFAVEDGGPVITTMWREPAVAG